MALGYAVVALIMFVLIITIPFGIASARIALFCLWPFGRTIIRRPDAGAGSLIGNIIWFVLAGWWLALGHLVTGVLMLCLKTWYLPTIPGLSAQFVSYTFEAILIFLNIGMTALGLWLGSVIPAREPAEEARIAGFFQALDMPVTRSEAGDVSGTSNRPVLAAATIVVGGLLIVAGIVAGSSQARWFDLSVGGALAALGARLAIARDKTSKKQYSTTV